MKSKFTKMPYTKIYPILFLLLIFLGLKYFGFLDLLSFDNLVFYSKYLKNLVDNNWLFSAFSFVIIYILVVVFTFPGAAILTLASGFLFGFWGIFFTILGATLGAIGNFIFSRYFVGNFMQQKYAKKLDKFNQNLAKNQLNYLFSLRFIPVLPFSVVNLFLGLTKIKLSTFVWTTAIGIIPGTVIYNFAGQNLTNLESAKDILTPNIIISLTILTLFSLFPVLIKRFKKHNL